MTIYLSNEDVRTLLPMDECIDLMEQVFRDEAEGKAVNLPRQHLPLPKGFHRTVQGIAEGFGVYGMKTYGSDRRPNAPNRTRYLVLLYSLETRRPRRHRGGAGPRPDPHRRDQRPCDAAHGAGGRRRRWASSAPAGRRGRRSPP